MNMAKKNIYFSSYKLDRFSHLRERAAQLEEMKKLMMPNIFLFIMVAIYTWINTRVFIAAATRLNVNPNVFLEWLETKCGTLVL